ncbi:hypothetical protein P2G88_12425 [Aliiglaciecola sp. CAU 1673]|uniref:hypothetical protein n=1 Tax=Aliiglaciecola sp. CAU 1673 TaxID=3032595 RepID=UPI0023DAD105|nr:hypothetical protein [Aliiglaciecola sp. CAU 1673]MDF2179057.1 hypothetical protein [Aliiglaciecola sp. CAU 1673]
MKRFVVLILEIAFLVVVLRSPFVQYWFSDMQNSLSDLMLEIALAGERQMLSGLREKVAPHIANLKDYQKAYIDDVMSSRAKLEQFNLRYCQAGDKNPYVYGNTLTYLCSEIKSTDWN